MKYQPPFGSSDPDESYVDRNVASGIQGSRVSAKAIEQPQRELDALVERSGFTPSDADLQQVSKAVRSQAMNYRVAGGTANALTVSLDPAPSSYAELVGVPLRIKAAAANTGLATLNVSSLGTKDILRPGGSALQAGDLQAGQIVEVIYDGTAFQMVSLGSVMVPGNFQVLKTPGTTSFVVPAGVTRIRARVWGAGGGGGGNTTAAAAGAGGGGGGGYAEGSYAVTPGATITVTVGAGGAGGTTAPTAGSNGGSSSFGSLCSATGGFGGGGPGGGGGGAGSGSGGAFNINGGGGGLSQTYQAGSAYGGGFGGAAYGFSNNGPNVQSGGIAGGFPGCGGNGSAANAAGGKGADGMVILEW
jgi:hypothetical protein